VHSSPQKLAYAQSEKKMLNGLWFMAEAAILILIPISLDKIDFS
jgi:ABC-type thiamin/hydroxymethylpyrimidine transport system permease subunit